MCSTRSARRRLSSGSINSVPAARRKRNSRCRRLLRALSASASGQRSAAAREREVGPSNASSASSAASLRSRGTTLSSGRTSAGAASNCSRANTPAVIEDSTKGIPAKRSRLCSRSATPTPRASCRNWSTPTPRCRRCSHRCARALPERYSGWRHPSIETWARLITPPLVDFEATCGRTVATQRYESVMEPARGADCCELENRASFLTVSRLKRIPPAPRFTYQPRRVNS